MAHLFLDTSNGFNYGLLDKDLAWLEFKQIDSKKTSQIIHQEVNLLLEKHSLDVKSLESLFVLSGPGSYTGMRVAEGLAQVFELEGIEIFSFTTFCLNDLLDIENPLYIYEAFKGELYLWSKESGEQLLLKSDFEEDTTQNYVTHGAEDVAGVKCLDLLAFISSSSKKVFDFVRTKGLREKPFYFRPVDVEFKKSTK